jgi:hypothetical protein
LLAAGRSGGEGVDDRSGARVRSPAQPEALVLLVDREQRRFLAVRLEASHGQHLVDRIRGRSDDVGEED